MILILLISGFAHSNLLVISDIDDTIKISHVRGKTRGIANAFRTQKVFPGMAKLYQEILNSNPTARFYYISNAPETLMRRSHQQFLDDNKFPEGHLKVRDSLKNEDFKLESIRELVKKLAPETLILFGDSAENDPGIYKKIQQEFPHIKQYSFIRHVHALQELEGHSPHFPFVSPLEISLELKRLGFLAEMQTRNIEASLSSELKESLLDSESSHPLFPPWVQCKNYHVPDSVKRRKTREARLLAMAVEQHCHQR